MNFLKIQANAKINLFLDIESKRDDGYHNISSLMQSIDLADTLSVSYEPSAEKIIVITVDDPSIPADEKNIVYKAADRLTDSGIVRIHIEKRIPSPAGLAGGSADAAAVIFALKSFGCINRTDDEILKIAAAIGADVPFCLVGGTKKISGIGDVIEDMPALPEMNLAVAVRGEGVSTPEAYKLLDCRYNDFVGYTPRPFDFEAPCVNNIYNVFEEVVLEMRDEARSLKDEMLHLGAVTAIMSGSGPSIVGIFDSYADACAAAEKLKESGAIAYACKTARRGIQIKNSAEAEF